MEILLVIVVFVFDGQQGERATVPHDGHSKASGSSFSLGPTLQVNLSFFIISYERAADTHLLLLFVSLRSATPNLSRSRLQYFSISPHANANLIESSISFPARPPHNLLI